jgi:hypothetical protein
MLQRFCHSRAEVEALAPRYLLRKEYRGAHTIIRRDGWSLPFSPVYFPDGEAEMAVLGF